MLPTGDGYAAGVTDVTPAAPHTGARDSTLPDPAIWIGTAAAIALAAGAGHTGLVYARHRSRPQPKHRRT